MQRTKQQFFLNRLAPLAIGFLFLTLVLAAPQICSAGSWASVGPGGGSIHALAIDPQNPAILYAGTRSGGIFKSTNGGDNWSPVNRGIKNLNTRALMIDPQNTSIVYAGTIDGLFKSTDAGLSWSPRINGLTDTYIFGLTIDQTDTDTLYAVASACPFKSTDGGTSWRSIDNGLPSLSIQALAVDPQNPNILYAGITAPGGLYKSTDGGSTWTLSYNGYDAYSRVGVQSLAVDPSTPTALYVGTDRGRVLKSTDGGGKWSSASVVYTPSGRSFINILLVDPLNPLTLYASDGNKAFRSINGGTSWGTIAPTWVPRGIQALAINPQNSSTLYAGCVAEGIFKSTSGGGTWNTINNGLANTDIRALAIDPTNTLTVYAGTNELGAFKSTNGGTDWMPINEGLTGKSVYALAIDPQNALNLYALIDGGTFKSTDAGANWTHHSASSAEANWIQSSASSSAAAILIDPQNPLIVYSFKGTINKSTNGGTTWIPLEVPERYYSVNSLAIDVQNPSTIYASREHRAMLKSTNGGTDWTYCNDSLTVFATKVAVDPSNSNTLYAATPHSGIIKSTDGCDSWTPTNNGLLNFPIEELVIIPGNPPILYASAYGMVYKSTDGAARWNYLDYEDLPPIDIPVLAIDPITQQVYAGTTTFGVFVYSPRPMITITINTNPAERSFTADGITYITSHTFSWPQGSSHTIAVASPQGSGTTHYAFADWSDGGAISHSITVPESATTFAANFAAQYQLTTSVSPPDAGTVTLNPISEDGYYASETVVELTATANSGYFFSHWSGDPTGSDRTQTLTMSAPRSVIANFMQQGSSIDLDLSAGGAAYYHSAASADTTSVGFADLAVRSGQTPYGTAIFSYKKDGVTVTEAGVPASPPTTHARIFIDYRIDVNAIPGRDDAGKIDVNTGICVVNYSDETATVTYTLRDLTGTIITSGTGTIAPRNHFSTFIHQFGEIATGFELPDNFLTETQFASLEISSDRLLSILALRMTANQRDKILYTTTPVADLTQPLSTDPVYFAQFADGGGYAASLILLNTSDAVETGILQLLDNDGAPLRVTPVGETTASSFHYSILAGGVYLLRTDGSPVDAKVGWVRLTPDEGTSTPVGSGAFGYNPGNVLESESGVPAAPATTHARIYVDLSGNHNTGLAIANLESTPAEITINAFEKDGVTAAGATAGPLELVANGHQAKFADELISGLPAGFTGVLDVSSTTPFAALTIRSLNNEDNKFLMTTFPVADVTRPAPSPILFPQIADGGGYRLEFILISPTGEASSTLSFFDESGAPMEFGD